MNHRSTTPALWAPALIGLAMSLCSQATFAAGTQVWEASQASELAKGTLDGTVLDDEGRIGLARPRRTLWGPENGIVWALDVAGKDGVFVALSGPGRLMRIDSSGAELWFDGGEESLITSVASDGAGGVYCGLVPDGSVLHLSGPQTIVRKYATGARFIWDLAVTTDGALIAATGNPGTIQRAKNAEDFETLFEAGEDPVRTLLTVDTTIYAGTGGRGRVVRLDAAGEAYVLYDADEPEIVGLTIGSNGALFALAVEGSKQIAPNASAAPPPTERTAGNFVQVTAEAPAVNEADVPAPKPDQPEARPTQKLKTTAGGAVYRIEAGGATQRIWSAGAAMPFGIARDTDGRILVATGDTGQLVSMDDDGRAFRFQRIPSNQASALAVSAEGAVFIGGTSDARVERLDPGRRESGSYLTPAIDASAPARWGRVEWQLRGNVKDLTVRARSGNTEEPDETWSDWSPIATRGGESYADVPVARRLQVQFDFKDRRGSTPILSALRVVFQGINRPPEIARLQVEPSGIVYTVQRPSTQSTGGPFVADDPISREIAESLQGNRTNGGTRRMFEPGMRTVAWAAVDPDADRLQFSLELRREEDESWVPLASGMTDPFHSWDARALPDGLYRIRLTASDRPDNAAALAREHRSVSAAFRIDHTRPEVTGWRVGADRIGELEVTDREGRIESVEYAWDDGPWRPASPIDGVIDSMTERFRIPLGNEVRAIRLRVTDSEGNVTGALQRL